MNIATLQFNPIAENTYIIWDKTGESVIIDAGNCNEKENNALSNFLVEHNLKPVLALNTHGHFDHALGVEYLKQKYNIPFAMSSKDNFLLESASISGDIYGIKVTTMPTIDIDLETMQEISFGETKLEIIKTPGHCPGHVCIYEPTSKTLFTGDTLFKESIGRTDLPGGDYSWIMRSIIDNLIPLGDDVRIFPGHGPESTIGHETKYNPFVVEVLNDEVNYK